MPIASRRSKPGQSPLPTYTPPPGSPDSDSIRFTYPRRYSWLPALPTLGRIPSLSRRVIHGLFIVGLALGLLLLFALVTWEPHFELAFYRRSWVRAELGAARPLAGCFARENVSSLYDVSQKVYGPRSTEVQAGMPLKTNRDCYNFAGTIHTPPHRRDMEPVLFHSYWRTDLAEFTQRQEWFLRSLYATQPPGARLILWSNGDLSKNRIVSAWMRTHPTTFETRIVSVHSLARGTALEGSALLNIQDEKAWVDGDLVRLLVLWVYGGIWIDMDSLLTRDLTPLLEHEFVTQWDCYDKPYNPFNGALLHFHQHSPYLCEAFHLMTAQHAPRPGSTDWGALLYLQLWRALVAGGIPPFRVLPWCFADPRSCRLDNRLPDPFLPDDSRGWWGNGSKGGELDRALHSVWVVHLHNQWEKDYPEGGWVERLLLARYQATEDRFAP